MIYRDGQIRIPGCRGCTGGDLRGFGSFSGDSSLVALAQAMDAMNTFRRDYTRSLPLLRQVQLQHALEQSIQQAHAVMVARGVDPKQALVDVLRHARAKAPGYLHVLDPADAIATVESGHQVAYRKALSGCTSCTGKRRAKGLGAFGAFGDSVSIVADCTSRYKTHASWVNCVQDSGDAVAIDCVNRYQTAASIKNCVMAAEQQAAAQGSGRPAYCDEQYPAGAPYGGDWAKYCTCEYTGDQAGYQDKCQSCPYDVMGACLSPPPWTEVGAQMRGIPKAHGTISAGAEVLGTVMGELPSPDDLLPLNMFCISLTDPVKFGMWRGIPSLAVYTNAFASPIPVPGFLLALAQVGGGFNKVWNKCGQNVLDAYGDKLEFLVGWFIGGGVAAAVGYAFKTLARRAGTHTAIGQMFMAFANAAPDIFLAFKSPDRWTNPDFYGLVGSVFQNAAAQVGKDPKADQGVALALSAMADVLTLGAAPTFAIIDGFRHGRGDQGISKAQDLISKAILGVEWSTLAVLKPQQRIEVVTKKNQVNILLIAFFAGLVPKLQDFFGFVAKANKYLTDLTKGAQDTIGKVLDKGTITVVGDVVGPIVKDLDKVSSSMNGILSVIQDLLNQMNAAGGAAAAAANRGSDYGAGGHGASVSQGGSWAPILVGAGAGFLVGGPVGGLVGAGGAMLIAGRKQK